VDRLDAGTGKAYKLWIGRQNNTKRELGFTLLKLFQYQLFCFTSRTFLWKLMV